MRLLYFIITFVCFSIVNRAQTKTYNHFPHSEDVIKNKCVFLVDSLKLIDKDYTITKSTMGAFFYILPKTLWHNRHFLEPNIHNSSCYILFGDLNDIINHINISSSDADIINKIANKTFMKKKSGLKIIMNSRYKGDYVQYEYEQPPTYYYILLIRGDFCNRILKSLNNQCDNSKNKFDNEVYYKILYPIWNNVRMESLRNKNNNESDLNNHDRDIIYADEDRKRSSDYIFANDIPNSYLKMLNYYKTNVNSDGSKNIILVDSVKLDSDRYIIVKSDITNQAFVIPDSLWYAPFFSESIVIHDQSSYILGYEMEYMVDPVYYYFWLDKMNSSLTGDTQFINGLFLTPIPYSKKRDTYQLYKYPSFPSYFYLLLIRGDVYNQMTHGWIDGIRFSWLDFPDMTGYYKVLVPIWEDKFWEKKGWKKEERKIRRFWRKYFLDKNKKIKQ